MISKMLVEAGIPHEVLNAKNHEKEAHIIMNAGQRGDRKSTRLNSSHVKRSRMPSSA